MLPLCLCPLFQYPDFITVEFGREELWQDDVDDVLRKLFDIIEGLFSRWHGVVFS